MRLLLFSNSTNAGEEYLSYTVPYINQFLRDSNKRALFIPFAGISLAFDAYFKRVNDALSETGLEMISLHNQPDMKQAVMKAELFVVGGGNTFSLLKSLQENKILDLIRERVLQGIDYIGWSAGANLACPTIRTTNDMPIVEPENFNALNLIPFQINPHYTDFKQPGHAGETREMRIEEFLLANQNMLVAGLREGTLFNIEKQRIKLLGYRPCRIFKYGRTALEMNPGDNFDFLMQ
jgi:dipeptidase E